MNNKYGKNKYCLQEFQETDLKPEIHPQRKQKKCSPTHEDIVFVPRKKFVFTSQEEKRSFHRACRQ